MEEEGGARGGRGRNSERGLKREKGAVGGGEDMQRRD